MKKILAFSGSDSPTSINKKLIQFVIKSMSDCEVTLINLWDYPAPLYSAAEEERGFPESMKKFKELFDETDAFIFASPEHNGFMPAIAKNAIDWVSRQSRPIFQNKPMLLMATSPGGRGGASNMGYIADAFQYRGAEPIFSFSLPSFNENFDADQLEVINDKLRVELGKNVRDFLDAIVDSKKK